MFKPVLTTLALVLASGVVLAQAGGASQPRSAEHEARRAEWQAKADARFAAADKDADGRLDRVEAQAFGERLTRNFERIDANADGELDKTELAAMRAKMGKHGKRMRGHMAYQRGLFKGMDDNADGAISRAELGTKMPRWSDNFAVIDANKDGQLAKDELKAWQRANMQARRAERAGS
ncbi:EF-hand domain-containing protein [Arenimonas sp. MALMAid1274]|uniref:EF-hand domain-containing protein n=1 Tax=Arenimonas sp. MALMAid1274 TaxID=3411630 RepID=UPI003BA1E71C